jgi:hypothetical protein
VTAKRAQCQGELEDKEKTYKLAWDERWRRYRYMRVDDIWETSQQHVGLGISKKQEKHEELKQLTCKNSELQTRDGPLMSMIQVNIEVKIPRGITHRMGIVLLCLSTIGCNEASLHNGLHSRVLLWVHLSATGPLVSVLDLD